MDNSNKEANNKRLFIGVRPHIPSQLTETLKTIRKHISGKYIKWVPDENLHFTLKFLGNTPDFYINSIENIINSSTSNIHPFNISYKSTGIFGEPHPKVLWIGLDNSPDFNALYNQLDINLQQLGFQKEQRGFSPHLTIGRFRLPINYTSIDPIFSSYKNKPLGFSSVDQIILFESILSPHGSTYHVVRSVKLQ